MRKYVSIILGILVGIFTTACLPDATPEEKKQMCEKLQDLNGDLGFVQISDAISVVDVEYKQKEQQIRSEHAAALKRLDDKMSIEREDAMDDAGKKAIEKEYGLRKSELRQNLALALKELKPKKTTAIKERTEGTEKENIKWEEKVSQCVIKANNEGIKKTVAQCRIKAKNKDEYWNVCH